MSLPTDHELPQPDGPPPNPNPRRPRLILPVGACDSHCHIFGPFSRFPLPEARSFTPNEAPEATLRQLHHRLGVSRAVIVQSQGHGLDHGPLLAALEASPGRYRGVALIRPTTSPEEVARLSAAGICGARFSFMSHLGGAPEPDAIRAVIALVSRQAWHIAIHVSGRGIVELEEFIRSIPTAVVIDHMACPDLADEQLPAVGNSLKRLIDGGRVWVKLSGADRLSRTGSPFSDVVPFAADLAQHAPERVLWGTDWPHVNLQGPMPDDGDLVDLIAEIAPTDALRQRMLVENPAEFFGFAPDEIQASVALSQ